MILPEDAWLRLLPHCPPRPAIRVRLGEAFRRVLSEEIRATVDVPFADVSAMDGYAVAGEVATERSLPVLGTIAAGDAPGLTLEPGQIARIMTGAIVPPGADRVVPVELSNGGETAVLFQRLTAAGAHIRRRAEVHAVGDLLLAAGSPLTAGALGLLATHGCMQVPVVAPPTVAVLTTGDEVVPPDQEPGPGQLRDSHSTFLASAVATLGLEVTQLGIAPDDPRQLRERIESGLGHDLLLLGGGVSMGEFDFVEGVLAELGAELLFDHVAVQPGKPLVAATIDDTLILGLPGNPASVMCCFWLFGRPVLRRMLGYQDGFWQGALSATLTARLPAAKARDRFLPAEITFQRGQLLARPIHPQGSHDLASFGRGSALVRVAAHAEAAEAGEPCEVLPLVDWLGG